MTQKKDNLTIEQINRKKKKLLKAIKKLDLFEVADSFPLANRHKKNNSTSINSKHIFYAKTNSLAQFRIERLLSYSLTYLKNNLSFTSIESMDEIKYDIPSLLLISISNSEDYSLFDTVMSKLKKNKGKIQLVVGGTLCSYLETETFLKAYPEIDYLVLGKGEEVFLNILDGKLLPGVYNAMDFGSIKPYGVATDIFQSSYLMASLGRQACRWGKCKFCHHQLNIHSYIPKKIVVNNLLEYIFSGAEIIYLYDNELDMGKLVDIFSELYKFTGNFPVSIRIFGLRIMPAALLKKTLEALQELQLKWTNLYIRSIAFGIEIYSQRILDIYKKGITISDIDNNILSFNKYLPKNTALLCYFLAGLPKAENRDIYTICEFEKKFFNLLQNRVDREGVFKSFMEVSFFRLSPFIPIYNNISEFGIKLGSWYQLSDFKRYDFKACKDIRTNYRRFTVWDEDEKKYLNRTQVMEKYQNVGLYKTELEMDIIKPECLS